MPGDFGSVDTRELAARAVLRLRDNAGRRGVRDLITKLDENYTKWQNGQMSGADFREFCLVILDRFS